MIDRSMGARLSRLVDHPGYRRSFLWMVVILVCLLVGALALAACATGSQTRTSKNSLLPVVSTSTLSSSAVPSVATTESAPTTVPVPFVTTTTQVLPPLTVSASGDVMGDRRVAQFMARRGGAAVFSQVRPLFQNADIGFVNLESPVSLRGTRNTLKSITFRSPPALVEGLAAAHINVVSLANNHALDYGPVALADTISYLDASGIAHSGAGANLAAARAPALLTTPAGNVAVLAFTDIIPAGFAATATGAGVSPNASDRTAMLSAIRAAAREARYVIVSFHWGIEYSGQVNAEQRSLAHAAIDAGAGLVLGAHPHVLQGLEVYRGKLIAYSLGNFVFDDHDEPIGETVVLQVKVPASGEPSFTCVPVRGVGASGSVPAPVSGKEADNILSRLTALSAKLGVQLVRSGNTVELNGGA
jgi:poly-gamma-glutamate capsule biosynthesis protein CapA/YwtB (metallophosphatase superfamily)